MTRGVDLKVCHFQIKLLLQKQKGSARGERGLPLAALGFGARGLECGVWVWVSRLGFWFLGFGDVWIARIWFSGFGFSIFVFS